MGWLRNVPIVSLLFAAAVVAVPLQLAQQPTPATADFAAARDAAREHLVRNPRLELDALGTQLLGAAWIEQMRAAAATRDGESPVVTLPPRMLARSQARLDELVDLAYEARLDAAPAWRLGVLDARTPPRNYLAHAFVHENMAGVVLFVAVLLLVGAPLERSWGSLLFGLFAIASAPVVAQAHRLLDASATVPWSGGAGVAGALVGAYFIRGLGGHFLLPAWLLAPAWLGVETFVVRGFWLDDLGAVPWATLCAAFGWGALVAGGLRLFKLDARVEDRAARQRASQPNPVVVRAARLRSDGDPYQAFDLIQAAWREDPSDRDVRECFFTIATEVGQPEVAAEAILPSLREAIKRGDVPRAIEYWFPLASRRCEVQLDPTAAVRLAEALLDEGHPEEALYSLETALASGASSSHAVRIVNIARDLDVDLTRRAAKRALDDTTLEPRIRAELEPIARGPRGGAGADASEREAEPVDAAPVPGGSASALERRVQAEHQAVETTAFPLDADLDLELGEPAHGRSGDVEAQLADQALDPGALSPDALAEESAVRTQGPIDTAAAPGEDAGGSAGDVLSHWRGDEAATPGDDATRVDPADSFAGTALLDAEDLELPGDGLLGAEGADWVDPEDDVTDTDLTPMIESTEELTSPLAGANANADANAASGVVFDQPTAFVGAPADEPAAEPDRNEASTDTLTVVGKAPAGAPGTPAPVVDLAIGVGSGSDGTPAQELRTLKALEAIPIQLGDGWLEIDVRERGKTRLPLTRIQALAVAAVADLGPKPVLVIDLLLSWQADPGEPLKSFRLRSDGFDPRSLSPSAGDPLAALIGWIGALERETGASCLPSRALLAGDFVRFDTLAGYERDVLSAAAPAV